MGIRFFTFFSLISISTNGFAASPLPELIEKAKSKKLSTHTQWMNLIHYESRFFGGVKSQADGSAFFLAPEGPTSPEAELIATLSGFFREPTAEEMAPFKELTNEEAEALVKKSQASYSGGQKETSSSKEDGPKAPAQHPICQFPARLKFLERELGWKGEGLPKIECYRLDAFRKRLDAKSASLVFSSFFLNNPSSAFGHSFLRINSGLWSQYGNYRNELLDTGINYAADGTGINPVLYAIFGMAGMIPGSFTAIPYYYKVREYNDFESRDLWSYDLTLTEDEIKMLVDHIWEEGSTFYFYYYFTENCSYHMFTLLDAAAPRLGLTKRLPYYIIPSDTIRVLNKTPGLVSRITYRPSVLSQFRYRLSGLNADEKKSLDAIVESKDPEKLDLQLTPESGARVLDTFSDQIELTAPKDLLVDGSEAQKLKQKTLVKRAALGVRSPSLDVPAPDRSAPHLAHGMRRVSFAVASERDQGLSEVIGFKFAMHDLLDPGLGYPRNMQIDFAQVRLRYRNDPEEFNKRLELDELNLFKITGLTPLSKYYPAKSVRAELGGKRKIDPDCKGEGNRCFPVTLDYGPGISWDPTGKESLTLFAFAQGRATYTSAYTGSYVKVGIGPRIGFITYFSDYLRLMITSELMGRFFANEVWIYSNEATLRYGFTRNWAIDVSDRYERNYREVMAQLHFYY